MTTIVENGSNESEPVVVENTSNEQAQTEEVAAVEEVEEAWQDVVENLASEVRTIAESHNLLNQKLEQLSARLPENLITMLESQQKMIEEQNRQILAAAATMTERLSIQNPPPPPPLSETVTEQVPVEEPENVVVAPPVVAVENRRRVRKL